MWSGEEPAEDEACAEGVDEYVGDEEGRAMREELLAEFHGSSVASGEGDYYDGVFEAWELPVVGGVGYRVREGGVGDDVSPVGGLDEGEAEVVDNCFWGRDERAIEDDSSDDGDCSVAKEAWEK